MHVVVCIKSVTLAAPAGKVVRTPENSGLNPFDRPAIERAVELARVTRGTVTALSMGPPAAEPALFEALALGADRAVLLCDPVLAGADTLATSRALAAAIRTLPRADAVLFGARASDSDTGQVGPQCATMLDMPLVCNVRETRMEEDTLVAVREADGFVEEYSLDLPCALTVHPDAGETRDVGLGAIERVFTDKTVQRMTAKDAGIDPGVVGEAGSPTVVLDMAVVSRDRQCEFLDGSPEEQASALVERLAAAGLVN
ncbi:MAG: electron transfer flavoprotein subunit beta/FixA family protein [Desulfatibacillaceae bacterium]